MTFPVGESVVTFTLANFDDTIVGLEAVDGRRNDDNITTKRMTFEQGRWYRVRLSVTDAEVQAWIDDEQVVDLPRAGHTFSSLPFFGPVGPLGISTFEQTPSALRNITLRPVPGPAADEEPKKPDGPPDASETPQELRLLEGKYRERWRGVKRFPTDNTDRRRGHTGQGGAVHIADGQMLIDRGSPRSDMAWTGASVSIQVYLGEQGYDSPTGLTGEDGTVTFTLRNAPSGTYTTNVTDVVAAGLEWDGQTPPNSFTK